MHKFLKVHIPVIFGGLILSGTHSHACNCTGASLSGDTINVYMLPDAREKITVSDAVELPEASVSLDTHPYNFTIDVKKSSILIEFNDSSNDNSSTLPTDISLSFDDINPQLADSQCTGHINGMYIQTNNPAATALNAKSSYSDHKVKLDFVGGGTAQQNEPSPNWSANHWIKVNLTFGCSAPQPPPIRNGMTWGYRGQSIPDGSDKLVAVGCNSTTQWGVGQSKCNPYKGETRCSAQRHILCVEEKGDIPRPAYAVNPGKENFSGWSPGAIKLSPEISGEQLTSLEAANRFCGTGWRMAEFHHGHWIEGMDAENHHSDSNPPWDLAKANTSGGWNFHGQFAGDDESLHKLKTQRFWVHIKNQPANCWDPE
jgi:hypothetical protein